MVRVNEASLISFFQFHGNFFLGKLVKMDGNPTRYLGPSMKTLPVFLVHLAPEPADGDVGVT